MGRGSYAKRYSELEGTDDEVENFIKRVRTSILSGDREWIARHVSYPLKTTLNGYKTIMLKNKRQLVANFDRIFYRGFKDRVGSSCACNMFNNEYGAMLGRGEIWICDEPRPPAGKSGYTIIALNNKPPVAARTFKNPKKGSRHFYKKARH